jgi:hypothetical protein
LPENNLVIPVRCGEQLMSQCDIEFSTGANDDSAAREVDNASRVKIATFSGTVAPRAASPDEESVILLQRQIYDTINFAAATQREVNVVNEVLVQWSLELCSRAPIAGMSSVSSSPFRAKAACRKWTYLRAMTAKR